MKEIEAESISFLVCRRQGLQTNSEEYLAGYAQSQITLPEISLELVLSVTDWIETMGRRKILQCEQAQ